MTESTTNWQRPGDNYILPEGELHVWRARIDGSSESLVKLRQTLSIAECERAAKFYFMPDRTRYVIGRGLCRILLGRCLGISADRLSFAYGPAGKPKLAQDFQQSLLHFNVAHSGDFVLVALAYRCELGVDIELIERDVEVEGIAQQFFSANERGSLIANVPADGKHDAFFTCWTRKEAYLKARGDGLSLPLDSFDVAFLPGQAPRLIETRQDPAEASRWTLQDLDVDPLYKAALACEGASLQLRTWDWRGDFGL
jgi:4'-phosphopantetheinyl transferase